MKSSIFCCIKIKYILEFLFCTPNNSNILVFFAELRKINVFCIEVLKWVKHRLAFPQTIEISSFKHIDFIDPFVKLIYLVRKFHKMK